MSIEPSSKNQRTLFSLIIEPFSQITFGLYVVAVSLLFMCLNGYLMVQSFLDQYQHVMEIFQVVDLNGRWELLTNDVFYRNVMRMCFLLFMYLIVIFYVIFKLTHRYYGPVVAINRLVDQMIDGRFDSRIQLRKNDEFQGLAKKINQLADKLEKK